MSPSTRAPAIPRPLRQVAQGAAQVLSRAPGLAGSTLVAAVSGGPDSALMLATLALLGPRLGFGLHAVHVNHQLGPAAEPLQTCAQKACERWGVSLEVVPVEVPVGAGNGLEDAARRARHHALDAVRCRLGAPWLATGHTASDVAETFLQRLLEGAGRGQASLRPVEGTRVRPLAGVTRAQVRQLTTALELPCMEDPMNGDAALLRGFLRQQVLPVLSQRFGAPERTLARACGLAQEDHEALEAWARRAWTPEGGAARTGLREVPLAVATRALRQMAEHAAGRPIRTGYESVRKAALAAVRPGGPLQKFKVGPVWLRLAKSSVTAHPEPAARDAASDGQDAAWYGSAPGPERVRAVEGSDGAGKAG